MSIDWINFATTLSATALGASVGVFVSVLHENRKKYKNNEFELINYFYNLNTALRNIGVFSYNLVKSIEDYEQKKYLMTLPISAIHFKFNETKLNFVQSFNYIFYENINQLKIDFNFLYELGLLYKEKPDSDLLYEILHLTVIVSNKIAITMENVNNFLKTYNKKETIIDKQCLENFNKIDIFTLDFKNLLLRTNSHSANHVKLVKQFEKEITNIKENWKIKFIPLLPWHKKAVSIILSKK